MCCEACYREAPGRTLEHRKTRLPNGCHKAVGGFVRIIGLEIAERNFPVGTLLLGREINLEVVECDGKIGHDPVGQRHYIDRIAVGLGSEGMYPRARRAGKLARYGADNRIPVFNLHRYRIGQTEETHRVVNHDIGSPPRIQVEDEGIAVAPPGREDRRIETHLGHGRAGGYRQRRGIGKIFVHHLAGTYLDHHGKLDGRTFVTAPQHGPAALHPLDGPFDYLAAVVAGHAPRQDVGVHPIGLAAGFGLEFDGILPEVVDIEAVDTEARLAGGTAHRHPHLTGRVAPAGRYRPRHGHRPGTKLAAAVDMAQLLGLARKLDLAAIIVDDDTVAVMSQQLQRSYPQRMGLYRGFGKGEKRKGRIIGSQRDALERIHHGSLLAIGRRIDYLVVYHHRGRTAAVEVDHIPGPLLYQIVGILDHRALVGRDDEELLAVFGDSHQRAGIVLKFAPRSHKVVVLLVVQFAVQDNAGPTVEGLQHLLGRRNRQTRIGEGRIDKTLVDLYHIAHLYPALELGGGIVAHEEDVALPVGLYGGVAYRSHPARGRLAVDNPLALRLQLGIEPFGIEGKAAVCIEEHAIPIRLYPVGRLVDVVDFDFGLVRADYLGLVAGRKDLGYLVLVD